LLHYSRATIVADKSPQIIVVETPKSADPLAVLTHPKFIPTVLNAKAYFPGRRFAAHGTSQCLVFPAAARLLWKIEKAYSLGIPKNKLAHAMSQTEEEHAYGGKYTIFQPNGRSFRT